jgi:hypothetical protein
MTDHHDVVVYGATPGGIASAVRAAREGLDAALVAVNDRLGGMMAGGLSHTDTTLDPTRARTPLLDEFFERVRTHYREAYGPDSTQYENCRDGLLFEPNVAEEIFETMVSAAGVTLHRGYHPADAARAGRELRRVAFEPFDDTERVEVAAGTFVDASYEGDLAAAAGVPYRVGRESREAFGEPHAGRLFSEKGMKLFPGSTGAGDDAVQAYDYRLCLTNDPDNRRLPEQPERYDREEFLPVVEDSPEAAEGAGTAYRNTEPIPCSIKSELARPSLAEIREEGLLSFLLLRGPLPNDKRDLNTADIPGAVDDYPEADWERRGEIERRHREHVLGLLYFLQNDAAVPEDLQAEAREWGLPEDEFGDDGFPFQLYVREARRVEGRTTFTEWDARLAEGTERAPAQRDAVAVTEYPMDSHDCRPVRRPGSLADGHHYLMDVTVPSQVPYRTLLPEGLDNLLVPVALSATHVGFGTVRLEPTWLQVGEAAGYAAALAGERDVSPGELSADRLQRRIAEAGGMLTFFDGVSPGDAAAGVTAAQYLGAKGFFGSYDARLDEPLGADTAERWARFAAAERAGEGADPTERARSLPADGGDPVTAAEFADLLRNALGRAGLDPDPVERAMSSQTSDDPLGRGAACEAVYAILD